MIKVANDVDDCSRDCKALPFPDPTQANEPAPLVVVNEADCYIVPKYYVLPFLDLRFSFCFEEFFKSTTEPDDFYRSPRGVIQMLEVVVIVLMEW